MVYLLHHLLEAAARQRPDATAVAFGSDHITYSELNQQASRLAALLQARGFGRGDRIGLYINKSIASVVALHGIVKTGAAYVPLDPSAPVSRLALIIADCGIRCLATSTRNATKIADMFPDDNPLTLIVLTDAEREGPSMTRSSVVNWAEVQATPLTSIPATAIETDLAYILYTSGSTGVPKGVMISHRTSLTFVNWAHETFAVQEDDHLSSHAPFHFDLSIFDIFVAFKAGACLALVPEGLSTFPIRLAEWIDKNGISIWYSVPSVLSALVLHGRLNRFRFPRLRTVLFAGEVFPVKFLRQAMAALPNARFYNLYGPTETNVITWYQVPPLAEDRTQPIPLGRACANMDVFGIDDDGQLMTRPGPVGELYARGSCLAYGYWGDREKTARSFVRNPLQRDFDELAYKTGDLVSLDEDGNYLFLGRRDHMIKSRGYRIELGEIESALYAHPLVKEAAAVAVPDDLIGNRLWAFVVLTDGTHATAEDLQRWCADRIPAYMVPETIDLREALPKTSTGKTDKPALVRSIEGVTAPEPLR
jgi:amino acid adenylation domain-containing protein